MAIKIPEPGLPPDDPSQAIPAPASLGRTGEYALAALCLLLGPLGMIYVDWKHAFLGLLTLVLFLGGIYLAWPTLMLVFLPVGFLLTAYRAHYWIHGDVGLYQSVFNIGFKSLFDSLPFFLPLLFDLSMLVLLESLLRQAWFNRQRGSLMAALVVACLSTPILMVGVRSIGKSLIRRALRPFQVEGDALELNA